MVLENHTSKKEMERNSKIHSVIMFFLVYFLFNLTIINKAGGPLVTQPCLIKSTSKRIIYIFFLFLRLVLKSICSTLASPCTTIDDCLTLSIVYPHKLLANKYSCFSN